MHLHRASLALLAALACAPTAHAGLSGSPASVTLDSPSGTLFDPTPLSLVDTFASLAPGLSISAGDGSPIGTYMQPGLTPALNEHITFNDTSIDIRADAGAVNAGTGAWVTGYASGAEYLFSGFQLSGNQIISSATLSVGANEVLNFSPGWLTLVSPASFSLNLADMNFVQASAGQSAAGADFNIALSFATAPVPEPSTLALCMAGCAALWLQRRRQA